MKHKTQFSSRIGLIMATVGSAVGLGNVWRFPAEVQSNGGAAFLIIYALCVLILGIPVMISEFALGRAGRSDAIGAFVNTGGKKGWWITGAWGTLASYMILCFYMVVSGWTLEYMFQSVTGELFEPIAGVTGSNSMFSAKMDTMIATSYSPLVFTFMTILINIVILIAGVKKGIERISSLMMPLLFIIMLVFIGVSLTLPGASDGLMFFLSPDFSKITPSVVINALGQAFFSLSLGMGILITYASYFPREVKLGRTALTVSALDMVVAVMMGLIIFPAVTSFGLTGESMRGTTLVFVTLPEVFSQMPAPQLWSALFFLLLSLAAITSTISIAEVSVSFISHNFKLSRVKSCMIVLLPLFVFSTICVLSFGPMKGLTVGGLNIFELLDSVTSNIMLPLCAIGTCLYIGWKAPKTLLYDQLSNGGSIRSRLYRPVLFAIRYLCPLLIATVFISYFL